MARTTTTTTARKQSQPSRSPQTRPSSTPRKQTAQAAAQGRDQAQSALARQVDERSDQIRDRISGTASDVREIANQLDAQDNDSAARLAHQIASRIEDAAGYLDGRNADELLSDLEEFGRSRPWVAAGAAAALGFVATRALSASRRQRHGGPLVNSRAGSGFDEADAERDYDDTP
jgi:ElaB/YqjD/DUF883 family membrane-anchored ribosome-binding protein